MVNVNDVPEPHEIPKDIIGAIFDKQKLLMQKYKDIEKMPNDIVTGKDTNVDTPEGQRWVKDFAWRTTEELCEALEAKNLAYAKMKEKYKDAIKENFTAMKDTDLDLEVKKLDEYYHYLEECVDALHFLTELCIIAGYNSADFNVPINYNAREMDCVYRLGLAMNCLKNKPWKQTQMLTDRPKFKKYIQQAYARLLGLFLTSGYTMDDVFILYFKKNAVNQFRQRSKY